MKLNYREILTEDDLLEVFKNDEILVKMKETINRSEKIYLGIWIAFLIGSFVVVEIISSSPTYQNILVAFQSIFINNLRVKCIFASS